MVKDRDEPVAQIAPLSRRRGRGASGWRGRVGCGWAPRAGAISGSRSSTGASTSRHRSGRCAKIRMKYLDASALLRVLFLEPGPRVPLAAGDRVVSSR